MRALSISTLAFISTVTCAAACATTGGDRNAADASSARDALLLHDKNMSALSSRSGMGTAFATMFDVDGVSLRNGTMPLRGRDAIVASTMRCGAACETTWSPESAETDGKLGYTWGTYQATHTTPGEPIQTTTGTYLTVWKRDEAGSWHAIYTSSTRDE